VLRLLRPLPLFGLALLGGCLPQFSRGPAVPAGERLAQEVRILRDEFGVPHIHARTDAGVVFAMAYAQAEDNFWQVEEDYIRALGRASNWYGETMLAHDLVRAAVDVEHLSRPE
jgi:acyl-homoserine-lactone acylase